MSAQKHLFSFAHKSINYGLVGGMTRVMLVEFFK